MATVDVDICNLALGIIGDRRIQAMTEQSREAVECARFYAQALDEALEAFDWPFARTYRAGAAPSGVEPIAGFSHVYGLPAEFIAMRGIGRDLTAEAAIDYVLSSYTDQDGKTVRTVATNKAGGVVVYTRRVTDVRAFSPLFVAALAAKLAQYIAMPLTKDRTKKLDAEKQFRETIELAAVSVANQGKSGLAATSDPDWIAARGVALESGA